MSTLILGKVIADYSEVRKPFLSLHACYFGGNPCVHRSLPITLRYGMGALFTCRPQHIYGETKSRPVSLGADTAVVVLLGKWTTRADSLLG